MANKDRISHRRNTSSKSLENGKEDLKKRFQLDKEEKIHGGISEEFQKKDIVRNTVLNSKKKEGLPPKFSYFSKLSKNISDFFSGITDLSGRYVQERFVSETHRVLQKDFENLQSVSNYLILSPLFQRADMVKSFTEHFPISVEIILRIQNLNFESVISKFALKRRIPISEAKKYYLPITKLLFPFFGRISLVISSYEKAFKILRQMKVVTANSIFEQETIFYKSVENIFEHFLPKIEKLYPIMLNRKVEIISPFSKDILELTPFDFLGSWGEKIQQRSENISKALKQQTEEMEEGERNTSENNNALYNLQISSKDMSQEIKTYPKRDKIFILAMILDYGVEHFWVVNSERYFRYRSYKEGEHHFSLDLIFKEFFLQYEKFRINLKPYTHIIMRFSGFTAGIDDDSHNSELYNMTEEEKSIRSARNMLNQQLRDQALSFIKILTGTILSHFEKLKSYIEDADTPLKITDELTGKSVEGTPFVFIEEFYRFFTECQNLLENGELAGPSSNVSKDSPILLVYKEEEGQ